MIRSNRRYPVSYSPSLWWGWDGPSLQPHPINGGALVMAPLPVGINGQPYMGMDPSAPATWVRPYNPQPGMVARLNFDGAAYQGNTPMGGTWRNPMHDRADVPPSPWWQRRRARRRFRDG